MPEYAAAVDSVIGSGVKKASWSMNSFGVRAAYRGRGIGRALLKAGEALVRILLHPCGVLTHFVTGRSRRLAHDF